MATYYESWVDYGRYSSNGGGGNTLEEAKQVLIQNVTYLASVGETVKNVRIDRICATCDGCGHVTKRGPRSIKHLRCPDCKGKDSRVTIL